MQHLRGMKHFDIVPLSFMLPLEYRNLVQAHRSGHRGPWIVKPAASSRGRGIYLVNAVSFIQLSTFLNHLNKQSLFVAAGANSIGRSSDCLQIHCRSTVYRW